MNVYWTRGSSDNHDGEQVEPPWRLLHHFGGQVVLSRDWLNHLGREWVGGGGSIQGLLETPGPTTQPSSSTRLPKRSQNDTKNQPSSTPPPSSLPSSPPFSLQSAKRVPKAAPKNSSTSQFANLSQIDPKLQPRQRLGQFCGSNV